MCLLYYEKNRWMVGWIEEKKQMNGWKDEHNIWMGGRKDKK